MEEDVLADIDLPDAEVLRQVDSLIDWDKEQEQSSSWWSSWMPGNADELQQGGSPDSTAVLAPGLVGDSSHQDSAKSLSSDGTVTVLSSGTVDELPPMDESEPDAKRRKLCATLASSTPSLALS